MEIDIVYLSRGEDYGTDGYMNFLNSYREHPTKIEHNLVILAKGWGNNPQGYKDLVEIAKNNNYRIIDLPDDGFGTAAFFRATKILQSKYILFLTASSEILSNNYLENLYHYIQKEDVGLVGAMGAWNRPETVICKELQKYSGSIFYWLRKMKILHRFKNSEELLWHLNVKETTFPNYSIRTTGYMIEREIFLEYIDTVDFPKLRVDGFCIEHGKNSLTKFILNKKRMKALVVGVDGKAYEPQDWDKSNTFLCPESRNLLIADRHCHSYKLADNKMKRLLEQQAWGKIFTSDV